MSSCPSDPSEKLATSVKELLFHTLYAPTEDIENYGSGGLYPVHFGDIFKEPRYKVIRRLGYGSFSTVWLVKDFHSQDSHRGRFKDNTELKILKHLSETKQDHPGKKHVVKLLDYFMHEGSNGNHLCLVFETMGASSASMAEKISLKGPRGVDNRAYPTWMVKSLIRQALLGLDFLHQERIAHGDFQPGNILFSISNLRSLDKKQLAQDFNAEGAISGPVRRLDGTIDPGAPRYLALNQSLSHYVNLGHDFVAKISDMGGAFFFSSPPKKYVTPVGLRNPELVASGKIDVLQDVWSVGCLIFEFLTGLPLLNVSFYDSEEDTNSAHFLEFSDILGPLPQWILSAWPQSRTHFDAEGNQIKYYIREPPEDGDLELSDGGWDGQLENDIEPTDEDFIDDMEFEPAPNDPPELPMEDAKADDPTMPPLEDFFDQNKPSDMTPDEAHLVKTLLRQILQYDREKRPTVSQILKHPWFNSSNEAV
ncbi:MAG: hypothetical protein M1834_004641 [Cirrosporium novae-zelandiae]|nr:MAG: hypothetical protein M1834_004641 [Cirrosporium novae-zelandiae]